MLSRAAEVGDRIASCALHTDTCPKQRKKWQRPPRTSVRATQVRLSRIAHRPNKALALNAPSARTEQ